jgi:TolB-like protein/Tfp pilus assembly protein PilF
VEKERVQRRLAAILAADVAGYSRLTGADEEGTIARLRGLRRELIDPTVASHGGRIVKTMGDGILIEFASVVDAVRCAVEVQRGVASRRPDVPTDQRIEFRVGIHLGDVVVEGDDLLGEGVNVAARLEGIAEPGTICLSGDVYRQVKGKVDLAVRDLGEQHLKNIAEPVRTYRVTPDEGARKSSLALTLPDKPSIAVLPFQNMSGDPEQEYFADGMVEEIITALSRFHSLFVIARNSSFTYKGRAVDVKQVGRELGVRYVLEGSVRKAANKVRISGQLVDATSGAHLWADRFEGELDHIFDLQDQVTASVVGAIAPTLERAEIERAQHKPTESLDAYDCYLRGLANFDQFTSQQRVAEALRLFNRAIELDPNFASAYGRAAHCYVHRKSEAWATDPAHEIAEAARLARRAVELGKDDAVALATSGFALAYVVGDLDAGATFTDRALMLNPNLWLAWVCGGWTKIYIGEPDAAIERFARAFRLNPVDRRPGAQIGVATAHFMAGRYDEAAQWAAMTLREWPDAHAALRISAASHALAGRLEQAQKPVARLLQLTPALCVSSLRRGAFAIYRRSDDLARVEEGLRKAGLPE